MAWAKELDAARTHLANVLGEFSTGMDRRVQGGGPGLSVEEKAYKQYLTETIHSLSVRMMESVNIELAVRARED